MARSVQAVFEQGVLRPLEPLSLQEHQQVTVIVPDQEHECLDNCISSIPGI